MSLEFEGRTFDPNVVGPIQTRFSFNGTGTFEHSEPIPKINIDLASSGVFPDLTPDDLPAPEAAPEIDVASKFLKIIKKLGELRCISQVGEFINRSDEAGATGAVVRSLIVEMKDLVEPKTEDENSPVETGLRTFLKTAPLVNAMISSTPPRGRAMF